ncbi:hypothetical protein [Bacteroides neonati]|uniref:hypothetical protein n=1 Tax=Bacteroides neonati TaxID=1347393 RepID=UPI0006934123|nr:hypothetical protein [Bacteroides neonati]
MNRDYLEELRTHLLSYHEAEQGLISTSPKSIALEMENYEDSYIWLRLPIPDEHPERVLNMIHSGVEELPNTCLAGILVAILKNRVPKDVNLTGMSIDNRQNHLRFCISGSISLEDLRTLCEQYPSNPDLGDGM